MTHDPKTTMVNGEKAEWTDDIRALWAMVVALRFAGETRPVESANYYTPRPYVDEYNRGSDGRGFTYVVGRHVCCHDLPREIK